MKQDLTLKTWAKKKELSERDLDRAIDALIGGKTYFKSEKEM